jgi:hypothetical protein
MPRCKFGHPQAVGALSCEKDPQFRVLVHLTHRTHCDLLRRIFIIRGLPRLFLDSKPLDATYLMFDIPKFFTRIAAYGDTTAQALLDKSLILDIMVPDPNNPHISSMAEAIEQYVKEVRGL